MPTAIKKLPQIFNQAHYTKCALREILVLQQFSHSNILGVKDIMVPLMEKDGKVCRPLLATDCLLIDFFFDSPFVIFHFLVFFYQS